MRILILAASLLLPLAAHAADYFTFISENCRIDRGLIVYTSPKSVELINHKGNLVKFPRSKINFIVIHNTFENPLKTINFTPKLARRMKRVFVSSTDNETFRGWPIKFIDNLVIFFDNSGKTHVLELEKILRLRPVEGKNRTTLRLLGAPPKLSYGDSLASCNNKLPDSPGGIIPTRVLGDKIQISEFLNNFESGYDRTNSFQERTYLYAKPFLYPRDVKLGFTLYQEAFENPQLQEFPVYFQWSQGKPYRFQSFTQLGFVDVPYLPTVEPMVVAHTELKSHFFHASFVGNLSALPAGTEYYSRFTDKQDSGAPFEADPNSGFTRAGTGLNYMALMGADYQTWSLSVGTAFLNYYVQFEDTYFREILASNVTPVVRLMFTNKKLQIYGIVGKTEASSDNVTDLQLSFDRQNSVVGVIDTFSFDSTYARGGLSYEFAPKTTGGANMLLLTANFNENLASSVRNDFKWEYKNVQVFFHKHFGEYVALRVFGNAINFDYDATINNQASKSNLTEFLFGGNFEFVF